MVWERPPARTAAKYFIGSAVFTSLLRFSPPTSTPGNAAAKKDGVQDEQPQDFAMPFIRIGRRGEKYCFAKTSGVGVEIASKTRHWVRSYAVFAGRAC